jgi:hypothetical protein
MSSFEFPYPSRVKLLIVADVDAQSANHLAEKFVPEDPDIDGIICCGPFGTDEISLLSPENRAVAQGDMASIIATLENIVCRVVYLPSSNEPPTSYNQQLHLTPNSINIHARRMALRHGLFISGFTETKENLIVKQINHMTTDSEYSDDEYDGVEMSSGMSSIQQIEQILSSGNESDINSSDETIAQNTGIFLLNYKYTHTLNHFLFHMPDILEKADVSLMVLHSTESKLPLPSTFSNFHIIVPPSLKNEGKFALVEFQFEQGKWTVTTATITS